MRSPGWRYLFPLAIVLGAAAVDSRQDYGPPRVVSVKPVGSNSASLAEPYLPPVNIS